MIFNSKQKNGFSLVETLVAVALLLIIIVGPMAVFSRTAKSSSFASEQVQAFFLAQEGAEMVQKIRDDLLLRYFAGQPINPWNSFKGNSGTYAACVIVAGEDGNVDGCGLAWAGGGIAFGLVQNCRTAGSCLLYNLTSSSGDVGRNYFTHNPTNGSESNIATPFTRRITITPVDGNNGVRVNSIVTWRTGSLIADQRVEVETYLCNVYGTP